MNISKLFWSWLMYCATPLYVGGSSKSNASNDNSVKNTDKRLVTDGSSIGVSADGSTVNLSTSDMGAVTKAFDFANGARQGVSEDFSKVLKLAGDSILFNKEATQLTQKTQSDATAAVKEAFSAVQDTVSGNKSLATTGMILGAVVAIAAWSRKKGS
jgi:hypothetical protein